MWLNLSGDSMKKMNKIKIALVIFMILSVVCLGMILNHRNQQLDKQKEIEELIKDKTPLVSEMQNIAELSTIECTYHNVAVFNQEDAQKILWLTKDKHFWMEYEAEVKVGFDVSKINFEIKEDVVEITIPKPQVKNPRIIPATIVDYVDKNSAKITIEDETLAIKEAQKELGKLVANDPIVMDSATTQLKLLLKEYINNVGNLNGTKYEIIWQESK